MGSHIGQLARQGVCELSMNRGGGGFPPPLLSMLMMMDDDDDNHNNNPMVTQINPFR